MAIKIGLTGGIGSGKSVVSHLLKTMGIPVYIADDESKRITSTDSLIKQQLINLLGQGVYINGVLNKNLLAAYIFSDAEHAKIVNEIIHPRVKEDFVKWVDKNSKYPVVAIESAILIEAGFTDEVDIVAMVYAPMDLRLQRLALRDSSSSKEQILKRIQSQMDDEKKKALADIIIVNDEQIPVIPQVVELVKSSQQ
ncbi:dephospho-CoA kinase [Bacteroides luti]|uniref:Dephospho-CoA kinase n=1 Tax=Bacteroides luti TaxID=1297750 RepID=A0A1M5AYR8_9BACE|nr:dephospho-CoA kinase [Bacteroides luti]SHF35343.1 dephospho-CoA kinase [Bacteroides luti]